MIIACELKSVCILSIGVAATALSGCGNDAGSGVGTGPDLLLVADDAAEPRCGDGVINQPGEQCDTGAANLTGSGCEPDCTFTCTAANGDAKCDDHDACNGKESCGADHRCARGTALADGASCGQNKICKKAVCSDVQCGDGIVSAPEECDDGNNVGGDGCDNNCKFSCVSTDAMRDCTPADPCRGKGTCNDQTHVCAAGMPLADSTACGMNKICMKGACVSVLCGNGMVDPGEDCDPPNQNGCDAACHFVPVCGNGRREMGEQCDDGNLVNLDGCDAKCRFEQTHRIDWFKMQFGTDAFCARNALGGAIVFNAAQSQLQASIDSGILDGSITILFTFLGLMDLAGITAPKVDVGVLGGAPEMPMGAPKYDGTSDLDWWYAADAMGLDMMRVPLARLAAAIVAKTLATTMPGSLTLMVALGGPAKPLSMSNVTVTVGINAASVPTVSMGSPPGHVAAEHLDPMLQSFGSMGQQNANGAGKLCGNVSASSLAAVPLNAAITMQCNQYTTNNSILDLLVGGCTAFGFIPVVKPTQPDQETAPAQPAGAGPPYKLSASNPKNMVVDTCKDKNNAVVNLMMCEDDAAYSSYFKFTSDRVIINK